ncbi:MAG TPA: histidine phosphatase family protein [Dehalococcoidia bacterium]|nr:histidine phosphatase family protein [Dehalococcoidia bacterium]
MRLILVRHGESVGNFENRLQGQEDYDLTELGRRQAELTAARLAELGVTALYSSPLLRAMSTARTIAARLGIEPVEMPGVSEYHFGEMSGATYAEVRQRFSTVVVAAERTYPGEEGREVFLERVTRSIWSVIDEHPAQTAAIVSHGGPIAVFCQTVLGLPYRRPMPFAIGNCSLNLIDVAETGERAAVLVQLNDLCHLFAPPSGDQSADEDLRR